MNSNNSFDGLTLSMGQLSVSAPPGKNKTKKDNNSTGATDQPAPEQGSAKQQNNQKKMSHKSKKNPATPAQETPEQQAARAKEANKARVASAIAHFAQYDSFSSKLLGWQALCRDIGVEDGDSITKCKKNIAAVYINIFDFVAEGKAARHWPSLKALAKYSQEKGLIFPKKKAKSETVLRVLLRHLSWSSFR